MRTKAYRSVSENVGEPGLIRAFHAMTLSSKNLKNTAVYIVRNILSCFDEKGSLKLGLNKNQKDMVDLVNRAVTAVNETRSGKNKKKPEEKGEKEKEARLFPLITGKDGEPENGAVKFNPLMILDISLLDKAVRLHLDQNGKSPFLALPAKAAEQVRIQVGAEFSSWLASLRAYAKDKGGFTGRPQMPGYLPKDGLNQVKFFAGCLGKKALPTIKGRELFLDHEKTVPLDAEAFKAYADFDLESCINKFRSMLGKRTRECRSDPNDTPRLVELRIVPVNKIGTAFKIEGVFECVQNINDNLFLAKMHGLYSKEAKDGVDFKSFCAKNFASLSLKDMPVSAGCDLGLNNVCSVSFTQGSSSVIVSNQALERKLALFDERIDSLKASLASPRQRELQARLSNKKASQTEMAELRALLSVVKSNPAMVELNAKREAWVRGSLHRLSSGMVGLLKKNGVEVLVVGQNKLWKNGSDLGAKGNRRFHATAHARLIEMFSYKCQDAGILMILVEESYTSSTSFAANEPLKCFKEVKEERVNERKVKTLNETNDSNESNPTPPKVRDLHARAGRRVRHKASKSNSKHSFQTDPKRIEDKGLRGWEEIHADANGNWNILRKACPAFKVNPRLNPGFRLVWLRFDGFRDFAVNPEKGKSLKPVNVLSRDWDSGGTGGKTPVQVKKSAVRFEQVVS